MTTATVEPLPLLTTGQLALRYQVNRDTVWDWIKKGVAAPGGARVFLRAERIGGQWKTTEQWARDFFAACRGSSAAAVAETPAATEARARQEQEKARKALGGKRRK